MSLAISEPVAQVSNLLYRRFPIGRATSLCNRPKSAATETLASGQTARAQQAGSLRYSRLGNLRYFESCAIESNLVLAISGKIWQKVFRHLIRL
jgi:hypothetical protein